MDAHLSRKFDVQCYWKDRQLLFAGIGLLLSFALQLLFAYALSYFIDAILPEASKQVSVVWFWFLGTLLLLGLCFGAKALFNLYYPTKLMIGKSSAVTMMAIEAILSMPLFAFKKKEKGYYLNVVTGSAFATGDLYTQRYLELPVNVLYSLLILVAVALLHPLFLPLFLLYIPLTYWVTYVPSKLVSEIQRDGVALQDAFFSETKKISDDKREINIAKATEHFSTHYRQSLSNYCGFALTYRFNLLLTESLPKLLAQLIIVLTLLISALLYGQGKLSIGQILLVYQLIQLFHEPIARVFEIVIYQRVNKVHIDRLLDLYAEGELCDDDCNQGKTHELQYELLDFALFSDGERQKKLIELDRLAIKKGDFVLLKGENGSGKSLLLSTLAGYGDKEAIDGRIGSACSREKIAFLTYPILVKRGSLEDNFFGKAVLPDLMQAFDSDGFHKEIVDQPMNLSLGEQKKLALMRTMSEVEAEVLLLDEPCENLDQDSRKRLLEKLAEVKGKKTVVVVDHSGDLAVLANRIFHLTEQRLVEE